MEIKEYLEKIAAGTKWCDDDDFCAYDYCGGNVDDAYDGGCRAGEIDLARDLLLKYFGGTTNG